MQVDVILSCGVQCFHCHFPKLQKKTNVDTVGQQKWTQRNDGNNL